MMEPMVQIMAEPTVQITMEPLGSGYGKNMVLILGNLRSS